jgi:hypothetical protein
VLNASKSGFDTRTTTDNSRCKARKLSLFRPARVKRSDEVNDPDNKSWTGRTCSLAPDRTILEPRGKTNLRGRQLTVNEAQAGSPIQRGEPEQGGGSSAGR